MTVAVYDWLGLWSISLVCAWIGWGLMLILQNLKDLKI